MRERVAMDVKSRKQKPVQRVRFKGSPGRRCSLCWESAGFAQVIWQTWRLMLDGLFFRRRRLGRTLFGPRWGSADAGATSRQFVECASTIGNVDRSTSIVMFPQNVRLEG